MKYYRLQITTASKDIFNKLSETLGVNPLVSEEGSVTNHQQWIYEVIENESGVYYDFINSFVDMIEPNFGALTELGIARSDITFWYLYAYDQQCNMELLPKDMKRLGDNGISLSISCWQK